MIRSNLQIIFVYNTILTYLPFKLSKRKSLKLKEGKNSKLKLISKIISQTLKKIIKSFKKDTQTRNKSYLITTVIKILLNKTLLQKRNKTNLDQLLLRGRQKNLQYLKSIKIQRTKRHKAKNLQKSLTIKNHKQF